MSKYSRSDLIKRLMATFLDELDEHVITLNDELLILEKAAPDSSEYSQTVRSLFRAAHSLKGAARSVDLAVVEGLCHHLEDLLGQLRDCNHSPSRETFQLLFSVPETLGRIGKGLRRNETFDQSTIDQLLNKLSFVSKELTAKKLALSGATEVPAEPDKSAEIATADLLKTEVNTSSPDLVAEENGRQSEEADANLSEPPSPTISISLLQTADQSAETRTALTGTESHSIRVSTEKLDKLLALSSEFLTTFRRSETWQSTVENLAERLRIALSEWQPAEEQLKGLIDAGLEELRSEAKGPRQTAQTPNQNGRRNGSMVKRRQNAAIYQKLAAAPAANTQKLRLLAKDVDRFLSVLKTEVRSIGETVRIVDEEIRGLRMRPFSDACLGFHLAVRELSISTGKEVELEIHGGDVELDRSVLESLKDPLLHIVRNAIQHGVESPSARAAAGKSRLATIQLSAALCGSYVQIEIRDDGRGIDEAGIRARARQNGLAEPQTPQELADMIFLPWFSTTDTVNAVSGRGVGLDVVANQVSALQGTVAVDYEAAKGTCFTLTVPLTLTKIRVVLVKVCDQTFAFPSASVQRLVRISPSQLQTLGGNQVLPFEGQLVSVTGLAEALKYTQDSPLAANVHLPAVVLAQGNNKRAFIVDELVSETEVVVNSLGSRLQLLRNVSGATILATGEIALILNASDLLRRAHEYGSVSRYQHVENSDGPKLKRLIVADDSPTTRILETSILEMAGYQVVAVADGHDAWEVLQAQGADLVVSDVEMPTMDGFSLTRTIRASDKWGHLPVILVTGLAKQRDREEGLKAGANAYVVKGDFDQLELLDTIEQLIQ